MINRWDKYFLDVCNAVANNSKCLSRNIGAVLVHDKSIIATGYNGPPRGIPHCGEDRFDKDYYLQKEMLNRLEPTYVEDIGKKCPRKILGFVSGDGLDYCAAAHAEQNCISNAARMGVSTLDSTLYMNYIIPCSSCMKTLINAGITEIVVTELTFYDELAKFLAAYSEIRMRDFDGRVLTLEKEDSSFKF